MDYERFENLVLGPYYHHAGSLHLYEKDFKKVNKLLENDGNAHNTMYNEKMPTITFKTLRDMDDFLKFEKNLRKGKLWEFATDDPFLNLLTKWLIGVQG